MAEDVLVPLLKSDDSFNASALVAQVFNLINPSKDSSDFYITELSIDGAFNSAVFALCKTIGLRSSYSDSVQTYGIVISYSAFTLGAQYLFGIGSGIGKLDLNGIAIAQLSRKLDKVLVLVGSLVKEPLISAKDFLEQAKVHIKNGNVLRAIKHLEQVNIYATRARSLGKDIENEDLMVDTLISSSQIIILSDILLEGVVNTDKGPVILPAQKLSKKQRENVSNLIKNNINKVLEVVNETKPGVLKKLMTINYKKKEADKMNKIYRMLRAVFPLLTTDTIILDPTSFEVKLPGLTFFPEGENNKTYTVITTPQGSRENICVWAEPKKKSILLIHRMISYTVSVEDSNHPEPIVTIENEKLVKVSTGEITEIFDIRDSLHGSWSKDNLQKVDYLASLGSLKEIQHMRLSSDNLSPEDVAMTVTAMSIARYVSLSGLALTSYQWMDVEDHFGNETEKFELSHMIIDSESGASVANICKKVMVVVLYHVDFQELNVFFSKLMMEDGKCEEVMFVQKKARTYKEDILALVQTGGWWVQRDDGYKIVIKKIEHD